jgi:hypothetical protein
VSCTAPSAALRSRGARSTKFSIESGTFLMMLQLTHSAGYTQDLCLACTLLLAEDMRAAYAWKA